MEEVVKYVFSITHYMLYVKNLKQARFCYLVVVLTRSRNICNVIIR